MDAEPRIVSMFVFFAAGENVLSRLIRRVCGGWSHVGLGFRYSDGTACYFEALFGKGVRGPKTLTRLLEWSREKPNRRLAIAELPLSAEICQLKYAIAKSYVGFIGYGELQLLAMWFFERIGRRWGWHVPRASGCVVCSTYVARVLFSELPLFDSIRKEFDEVTPGSAWQVLAMRDDVNVLFYPEGKC